MHYNYYLNKSPISVLPLAVTSWYIQLLLCEKKSLIAVQKCSEICLKYPTSPQTSSPHLRSTSCKLMLHKCIFALKYFDVSYGNQITCQCSLVNHHSFKKLFFLLCKIFQIKITLSNYANMLNRWANGCFRNSYLLDG